MEESEETQPPESFYENFGPIVIRRPVMDYYCPVSMEEYYEMMQRMWTKLESEKFEWPN